MLLFHKYISRIFTQEDKGERDDILFEEADNISMLGIFDSIDISEISSPHIFKVFISDILEYFGYFDKMNSFVNIFFLVLFV